MSNEAPKSKNPSPEHRFDPVLVARIAAQFLPPLPLPEYWHQKEPEELEECLAIEMTPNAVWLEERSEHFEAAKERLLNTEHLAFPSQFEILAEAALNRARVLLELAHGRILSERNDPSPVAYDDLEMTEKKSAAIANFVECFGARHFASIERALELALPKSSPKLRQALFDKVIQLKDDERNKHGFTGNPKILSKGMYCRDYPWFEHEIFLAKDLFGEALRKQIARDAGRKGGKKTQAKRRADPLAEPRKKRKRSKRD